MSKTFKPFKVEAKHRPPLEPVADKLTKEQRRDMLKWGKRAVKGLDASHVFMGVMDEGPLDVARLEFTLQLGHALLTDKPIILAVPNGVKLPKKLAAIADEVAYYNPGNLESMEHSIKPAMKRTFTKLDKATQ